MKFSVTQFFQIQSKKICDSLICFIICFFIIGSLIYQKQKTSNPYNFTAKINTEQFSPLPIQKQILFFTSKLSKAMKSQYQSQAPSNPNDKYSRLQYNQNIRNSEYYTPPTYVRGQNPEFWKSPLTSVELYRKNRARSINLNQNPAYQPEPVPVQEGSHISHQGQKQRCDWKQILFWALVALAVLLLALGLFFLIRALIGKGQEKKLRAISPDIPTTAIGSTGVNPIYVAPIPYSSVTVPSYPTYSQTSDGSYTSQTSFSSDPKQVFLPVTNVQRDIPTITVTSSSDSSSNSPTTQPTVNWIINSSESYVNPLDVYP